MNGIVCGFSGRIGSGKTSVSKEIAHQLNWPRVSFGEYVENLAKEKNLDSSSRSILQNLGESLINDGIEKFCRSVIAQVKWRPGQYLVIDGIRHQAVMYKLKEIVAPSRFILIHIYVNEDHRLQRITQRDIINKNEWIKVNKHSTEKDAMFLLPQVADITINGEKTLNTIVGEILSYIRGLSNTM